MSAPSGSDEWLIAGMIRRDEQTDQRVTFACGHQHTIFQANTNGGNMEQVITERLRRHRILCHTCQYFAVVPEVQEDWYVDALRGMGRPNEPDAPNNPQLLQMYYDMVQTTAQRVNQGEPTDVMEQCMNELCRLIIARLTPRERELGLQNFVTLQERRLQTHQESRGPVDIVRRLTEAITNADAAALDENNLDTTMKDPGSSLDTPMKDGSSPATSQPQPPAPETGEPSSSRPNVEGIPPRPSTPVLNPGSSSPGGPEDEDSPSFRKDRENRPSFMRPELADGSTGDDLITIVPGGPAPAPGNGTDVEETSVWGASPPHLDPAQSDTPDGSPLPPGNPPSSHTPDGSPLPPGNPPQGEGSSEL